MTDLDLTSARTKFAIRTQQLRTVKFNQLNNRQFADQLWSCVHCDQGGLGISVYSQAHIVFCPAYQHLRKDKDLNCDRDLIQYFQSVIKLLPLLRQMDMLYLIVEGFII